MLGESLNMVLIIKMVILNSWGLLLNNRIALPALLVWLSCLQFVKRLSTVLIFMSSQIVVSNLLKWLMEFYSRFHFTLQIYSKVDIYYWERIIFRTMTWILGIRIKIINSSFDSAIFCVTSCHLTLIFLLPGKHENWILSHSGRTGSVN